MLALNTTLSPSRCREIRLFFLFREPVNAPIKLLMRHSSKMAQRIYVNAVSNEHYQFRSVFETTRCPPLMLPIAAVSGIINSRSSIACRRITPKRPYGSDLPARVASDGT